MLAEPRNKKVFQLVTDDGFQEFAEDRKERDGAVVGWIALALLLVERNHICNLPSRWKNAQTERKAENLCYMFVEHKSSLFEENSRNTIGARGLGGFEAEQEPPHFAMSDFDFGQRGGRGRRR